ncbi:MAG: glutamate racemase [Clostridiales bacterium]|nr:glutamate racemase [Clostridiales bacterium]
MGYDNRPIGFFDSGLGGLSTLREARKILPRESFIYYADNLNSPYGNMEDERIIALSRERISYLLQKGIKALVIACNTVTAAAINQIREMANIPVIGMEPAIAPALKATKTNKVLLLATKATLRNKGYCSRYGDVEVACCVCLGLAPFIERNYDDDERIVEYIRLLAQPYSNLNFDCIVLGCTHYVLKKKMFEECFPGAAIIDGNEGTALHLLNVLASGGMLSDGKKRPFIKLIMTDGSREKYDLYRRILKNAP